MMMAQSRPTNQARAVAQGMSGSSVLATAERTSGYGESSSGALWGQRSVHARVEDHAPNQEASTSRLGSKKPDTDGAADGSAECDGGYGCSCTPAAGC